MTARPSIGRDGRQVHVRCDYRETRSRDFLPARGIRPISNELGERRVRHYVSEVHGQQANESSLRPTSVISGDSPVKMQAATAPLRRWTNDMAKKGAGQHRYPRRGTSTRVDQAWLGNNGAARYLPTDPHFPSTSFPISHPLTYRL